MMRSSTRILLLRRGPSKAATTVPSSSSSSTTTRILPNASSIRFLSDSGASSITYSGGQATEGQGGYYGSGGARHIPNSGDSTTTTAARSQLLALAADVQKVHATMTELEMLEQLFLETTKDNSSQQQHNQNSPKSLEIRATMKKLMTNKEFLESLNRLEVQGEPVWGLSTSEREMITLARTKVNDS